MWSQNKITCRRKALPALLFLLLAAASLGGCGYQMAGSMPSVMGDTSRTLKVKSVDQPTLYPWMGYIVRSALRDEVSSRNLARWVDSGQADNEISLKVESYTMYSQVRDVKERTLIFTGSMTISAVLYDGRTNDIIWRSGPVSYSDSYDALDEKKAAQELSAEIIRRITANMRMRF